MGKVNIVPPEALEHLVEDYGFELLLEMNDIEPYQVIELLVREGLLDLDDLRWEIEDED